MPDVVSGHSTRRPDCPCGPTPLGSAAWRAPRPTILCPHPPLCFRCPDGPHCRPAQPDQPQPHHGHHRQGAGAEGGRCGRDRACRRRAGFRYAAEREGRGQARHRRRRHQVHRRCGYGGAAARGGRKVPARQRHYLRAGRDHRVHRRQAGDLQRHDRDREPGRRGGDPHPVLGQLSRHRGTGRRHAGAGAYVAEQRLQAARRGSGRRHHATHQVVHAEQPVQSRPAPPIPPRNCARSATCCCAIRMCGS